jgi:hypothetical protein
VESLKASWSTPTLLLCILTSLDFKGVSAIRRLWLGITGLKEVNIYLKIIPRKNYGENILGPSHFDELHYLFNWEWTTEPKPNDVDNLNQEFSKHFVKLWVSFADTG